ncbi:MAG: O-antigen biosynthesis protein WlbH [Candidatus Zixiibacteriota bacterium]
MTRHILERPPKILILGEAAAVHTRRWVDHFRDMGWTVRWLSFPPTDQGTGVEEIPMLAERKALAIWRARKLVRTQADDFRPDIVSALFLPDYGWLACLIGHHPLAVSAWGSDVLLAPRKSILHRWRIQYVLRHADWVFCDAAMLGQRMVELGAEGEHIRVVPLGVSDAWLDVGRNKPRISDRLPHVVTNRRLEPLYRTDTFVRAVAAIEAQRPGAFRFTLVGDGSQRGMLESLASELGVRDRIEFTGYLPEEQLRSLMSDADIFVSCSSSDGTSVSLLEAMAARVFPIVTNLPANREWVIPGEGGTVFPVGDHERLATTIIDAARNAELRAAATDRNYQLVTQRGRWSDNMEQVEEDLLRLIADRHQSKSNS